VDQNKAQSGGEYEERKAQKIAFTDVRELSPSAFLLSTNHELSALVVVKAVCVTGVSRVNLRLHPGSIRHDVHTCGHDHRGRED